jgi:hypothetical protein
LACARNEVAPVTRGVSRSIVGPVVTSASRGWFARNAEEIGRLLGTYRRVVEGHDDGRSTWKTLRAMNQLGVTRGTMNLL